jgi:hypothetical protein
VASNPPEVLVDGGTEVGHEELLEKKVAAPV